MMQKEQEKQGMQQAVSQEPEQLQPYEQQRMDNIARNQRKLFQMQYGTLPSAQGLQQLPLTAPEKKKRKQGGSPNGCSLPHQDTQQQGEIGKSSQDPMAAGALSQPASKPKQARLQAPASTTGLPPCSRQLKGVEPMPRKALKGAMPASDPAETAVPPGNEGLGDPKLKEGKNGRPEMKRSLTEDCKDAAQPVRSTPKPQPCADTATQPKAPREPVRRSSRDGRRTAASASK